MTMIKFFFFLFPLGLFANSFEVSIASVFQNEAPFLKEWIEFHKLVGVEHFYLYNNNSTDHFQEVLNPYIENGLVELFDWSEVPASREEWHLIQRKALLDAVLRTQGVSKWVAFIDADEFIFPVKDTTLPKFLKKYEAYGAVTINWQVFGTSHIEHLDKNRLMIEQLIYRNPVNSKFNRFVKSIVQVNFVDTQAPLSLWSAHAQPLVEGAFAVEPNETRMTDIKQNSRIPIDKIRIHHYAFRDEDFFQNIKLTRVNVDKIKRETLIKEAEKANSVKDESILIYANALKKAMNLN